MEYVYSSRECMLMVVNRESYGECLHDECPCMVLSLRSHECVGVFCPKVNRELHGECLVSVHGE